MSAEGPARKPTSEPPDVDSLMSRLDGEASEDRISEPGGERRPSAAELLGGRGRRAKRAIRVPDDAVPAASPPSQPNPKRSVPPPPPAAAEKMLSAPSFLPEAVRSQRIISVGGPSLFDPPTSTPNVPASAPAPTPAPTSEPTPIAPAVAAIAPGLLAPMLDPVSSPMPAFGPASDVRLAAAPAADVNAPIAPPRRSAPPPPMRTPTPFASPFANNPPPNFPPSAPTAISPSAVSTPPPGPTQLGPQSAPAPSTSSDPAMRGQVTLPNLDAQVREALALLEREDFEASIDISVQVDEAAPVNGPQSSEESLADEELEVVENPVPSKKVHSAPNPPPRRAGSLPAGQTPSTPPAPAAPVAVIQAPVIVQAAAQPSLNTLPSAAATEPSAQPSIVVAAAATAVSGPVAGPTITTPAVAPAAPAAPPPEAAEIRKKKRQWFEELFNDDFARTMPRLDPRFLEREVGFIEDALGCDKGATVLDLGCGPGEQAVALASRGYEVIGVDLSLAMLARASDEAAEKGQRINFLQGDMRDLTFDEAFDGIYCFNTTFGYFDDGKNAEVIQKIHKALRRGGRFLLDVVNRDYIAPRTPSMVWFEGDGCVCMDEVQLNGLNSRLVIKRTMMMEDGRQREIEYSIRLYALHELGKLLHENGFRVAEVSGDTSTPGSYFGSESPRILILAEKR